ncbi:MAG: translation initiation factor IF-2 associated domain-containing protein, partial [Duganella sp.]
MSQQTTIRKLAELVNTPVEKLIEQLAEAGMKFSGPDQEVSSTEKMKLLGFLRRTHGKTEAPADDAAASKKITLNRRKVQEVTVKSAGPGRASATVNVEVRQKRTYVKPTESDTAEAVSQVRRAGPDDERAEILRKLEESRQRNLEEQQRLAEVDRVRAEELERKRQVEVAARAQVEAEAAEKVRAEVEANAAPAETADAAPRAARAAAPSAPRPAPPAPPRREPERASTAAPRHKT